MVETSTKLKVIKAVEGLPTDATWEDAMERIFFLYKVEQGLKQARAGEGISQDQVEAQIKRWQ